ncbi:MAG TPA: glycosyltransferase family 87 protein [Acidobacteriaceae bacterium]
MLATETKPAEDLAADAEKQPMRLPAEMRAFWLGTLVVLLLTLAAGWVKYREGTSPYNWNPLSDRLFFDLDEYPGTYTLLHSSAFFNNIPDKPWPYPMWNPVAYPPFAAAVMAPLYAFRIPGLLYLIVAAAWLIAILTWAVRRLRRAGLSLKSSIGFPLTVIVLSFPIARLIHQGNIELVVWMLAALGVWAFWRGSNTAAAVLLGLAAAMKLFPIVLLALLLPRGRYRAFAVGIGTFVGATVASLWWLGPSIGVAWRGSLHNVFFYQGRRMAELSLPSLASNHSVGEMVKVAMFLAHGSPQKMTLPYYASGAALLGFVFFKKLWKLPEANQLLALSTFMVMLPTISYFHTLVHLYAPLAVLCALAIRAQKAGVTVPGLKTTMLLFLPLFAPFTVLNFPRLLMFCGLLQAVVLMALFLHAAEYPLELPGERGA